MTPPKPGERRGPLALPGIDQIPLDAVKLTNREMQKRFVILEIDFTDSQQHGVTTREVACKSYITECADPDDYSGKFVNNAGIAEVDRTDGSTPYSFFENDSVSFAFTQERTDWYLAELRKLGSVKVVSLSLTPHPGTSFPVESGGAFLPFLMVQSVGNRGVDEFPVSAQDTSMPNIQAAIRANKVLYVAGHDRQNGRYVRHSQSSGCKGADEGCIWAPFVTPGVGAGTSTSAPRVAAALASVLAVFPDTSSQNLAKFAKACAPKGGSSIEALLRQSGGVGVADFTCMGGVMSALANLPTGGRTTTTVNGSPVTVSGRTLSLPFAGHAGGIAQHFPDDEEESEFSFGLVPTGGNNLLLVGVQRHGDLFASAGAGLRDDFFGFSNGHGRVSDTRLEAGHENAFIRFAQQRSEGGSTISSAQASTLGLTLQKEFQLGGEDTTLHLAAHADKFLGGEAEIPFGSVNLKDGDWEHRVSLGFLHRF